MSDSEKLRLDLAKSSLASLNVTDPLGTALSAQRPLERLVALGGLRNDPMGLVMRGFPSPEIEKAIGIASGRATSLNHLLQAASIFDRHRPDPLKLHDPFEKLSALSRALEGVTSSTRWLEMNSIGLANAAAKLSMLESRRLEGSLDRGIPKSVFRHLEQHAALTARESLIYGLSAKEFGALSRARHWVESIERYVDRDYSTLLGIDSRYQKQFDAINIAARRIADTTAGLGLVSGSVQNAALSTRLAGMETTTTKMSIFAGAIDILGAGASSSHAAYRSLLGAYNSAAMLERNYWGDPRERARYYRDQEVDEGLVDTDNAATVEALIESGVVEGGRTRAGTLTAVVDAGPIKLRIIASRPKVGAFRAIDAFEAALRAFVSAKLEEAAGPNWFKLRVPGEVLSRAKERRREAMRAGEPQLSLIHYTDIGDLAGVILRRDNWGEVFEAVFDRAEWFRVDVERLNANRRSTMHSRPVDPVQLCEIVFTVRRLISWMERDGAWVQGWDDDM